AELQRIIKKCLTKDPSERYQSTKEMAIDLRELIREYETQPLVSGLQSQPPASAALSQAKITDPNSRSVITGENSQDPVTAEQGAVSSGSVQTPSPVQQQKTGRWIALGAVLLLVAAAGLLSIFWGRKGPNRESSPSFRNTRITKLTSTGKIRGAVISPDG